MFWPIFWIAVVAWFAAAQLQEGLLQQLLVLLL
jgi:hypothetical protein